MQFFNNVGHIEHSSDGKYVSYRVYKTKDIVNEIIPHFDSYPLQSTKYISYFLWKKSAELMSKKIHLTEQGFKKLLTYKASFNKKLNAEIFNNQHYKNVIAYNVENIIKTNVLTLDSNYIAGFTAADGSFTVTKPSIKGKWPNYDAYFRIHQNVRDKALLEKIQDKLGCGEIHVFKDNMCNLSVRNKIHLADIILPFFDNYSLNMEKQKDFLEFKTAILILKENIGKGLSNLNEKDKKILNLCISKMNRNRYTRKDDIPV